MLTFQTMKLSNLSLPATQFITAVLDNTRPAISKTSLDFGIFCMQRQSKSDLCLVDFDPFCMLFQGSWLLNFRVCLFHFIAVKVFYLLYTETWQVKFPR